MRIAVRTLADWTHVGGTWRSVCMHITQLLLHFLLSLSILETRQSLRELVDEPFSLQSLLPLHSHDTAYRYMHTIFTEWPQNCKRTIDFKWQFKIYFNTKTVNIHPVMHLCDLFSATTHLTRVRKYCDISDVFALVESL